MPACRSGGIHRGIPSGTDRSHIFANHTVAVANPYRRERHCRCLPTGMCNGSSTSDATRDGRLYRRNPNPSEVMMALRGVGEPDIRSRSLRVLVHTRAVNVLIAASCLLAAACGSSTGQSDSTGDGISGFTATRTGAGIIAAGGKVSTDKNECPHTGETGVSAENTIKIAYAGPDITQLAEIGLETIDTDRPSADHRCLYQCTQQSRRSQRQLF